MKRVGITGPIGSGKSYISKEFEKLGIKIFNSDDSAKYLMDNNNELKEKIIKEFGQVYDSNGNIIPGKIKQVVFTNKDRLRKLNEIVHPYVIREYNNFCEKYKDEKYTIAETAILYETKMLKNVDFVILVYTKEKTRIERISKRPGYTSEDYNQRMKSQIPIEYKITISDFIIENNENDNIQTQINRINKILSEE